jgi:pimeloyl-ACP methyl ester carboxylesterase
MAVDVIRTPLAITMAALTLIPSAAATPAIDRLVDVGGYRLHFHVIPGKRPPILFEAGGGDDGSVWKNILEPVAAVTGATLIAYDRAGFGKSEKATGHGIANEVRGLEIGLAKLGYATDIMLVAHSLGGFYATLYASRHAQQVKSAVLIDANLVCFFTDDQLRKMRSSEADPARYRDFEETIGLMRTTVFAAQIPVIDIVAERTLFDGTADADRWRACHKEFVSGSPQRQGIVAHGSGHYVFISDPELVTAAIVRAYAGVAGNPQRAAILQRGVAYAVDAINEVKNKEATYRHSENDLNEWGYRLMQTGDRDKALAVFQLNVRLYPQSANVYDSLADCYEAMGNRAEAMTNYQHALDLDPNKKHSAEHLRVLASSNGK